MLSDGRYSAWFRIPDREGTGVVTLQNGRISGSDSSLAYDGSYVQNEAGFTASIVTRRHTPGTPSIFGIDELDIELVGSAKANTASCKGIARQRPDVPLEIVLIRMSG
jgi:hypothetical protein